MAKSPPGFDYHRYLASREWALLREQVRERSGNTCEHCFVAPQQAVHHLTYERKGHELLTDLMAICNPCHAFVSGKSKANPLADYAAVTPAFAVSHVTWKRHLIVPYRVPDGVSSAIVNAVVCEKGCIFCGYVDDNWVLFAQGLELR